jgi:hypothetical protein
MTGQSDSKRSSMYRRVRRPWGTYHVYSDGRRVRLPSSGARGWRVILAALFMGGLALLYSGLGLGDAAPILAMSPFVGFMAGRYR